MTYFMNLEFGISLRKNMYASFAHLGHCFFSTFESTTLSHCLPCWSILKECGYVPKYHKDQENDEDDEGAAAVWEDSGNIILLIDCFIVIFSLMIWIFCTYSGLFCYIDAMK